MISLFFYFLKNFKKLKKTIDFLIKLLYNDNKSGEKCLKNTSKWMKVVDLEVKIRCCTAVMTIT